MSLFHSIDDLGAGPIAVLTLQLAGGSAEYMD